MFFFTLASQIHLLYQPSSYDTTQPAYLAILSASPRLMIASMSVFFIVQQFDIRFFAFLKTSLPQVGFAYRTGIALIVSQFLDTFLFSFAGLWVRIVASVVDIMIISFIVKLIVISLFHFICQVG